MKSVLSAWTFCLFCNLCVQYVRSQRIRYNTYATELTRATQFVPHVLAKSCFLLPDSGPCRGSIKMYAFNPATKNCTTFHWGGCMGNGNRFDTEKDCLNYCISKPGYVRSRPKWCSLRFDYGFCFGAVERWYFDINWKVCKKTLYSGCGGNKNNFYSLEQCDEICRFAHGSGSPIEKKKSEDGLKKVIILNPWNSTPKRGHHQQLITESAIIGTKCVNVTKITQATTAYG